MLKNSENNGTEEIGLVTPTPCPLALETKTVVLLILIIFLSSMHPNQGRSLSGWGARG